MKKWTLIVDVAKCHNCNNCFIACKDEFVGNDWSPLSAPQPHHGHRWMNIHRTERGQYPLIDVAYLPQPCQHCENPPCMKAAKKNAITKREDGIVIIDPVKAKGQRDLTEACPYGSIWWNDELATAQKCTLCAHLLDAGWDKPRCVQACPTGALSIVQVEDKELAKMVKAEGLTDYKPELGTSPRTKYKNLYRYTTALLTGSVALTDVNECAENAKVTLLRNGKKVGETVTNNYGDFKFDQLPAEGGEYTVKVAYDGRPAKSKDVSAKGSINIGVVYL